MPQIYPKQAASPTAIKPDVELRRVFKVFKGETAVRGVDLNIQKGEFFGILGPSGCGKTTTLRLIAGFEMPSAGEVLIQSRPMNNIPSYRRPVNTVFQSYALFNHLTVAENVAFGLRIQKLPKQEILTRVREALVNVKMDSYGNRYPQQLSGGQQQRVALARALVNRPAVVLLDEPLGALDLKLRKEMQVELSRLHRELGLTFVMVTHDQEEALSLSDRIAVMRSGTIEQVGTPNEIYEQPRTPFVADFIGDTNLFEGRVEGVDGTGGKVVTSSGLKIIVQSGADLSEHEKVIVCIRPEKIHLSVNRPDQSENFYQGQIEDVMYLGTHLQYLVKLLTGEMVIGIKSSPISQLPSLNATVYIHWSTQDCIALRH